MVVVVVSARSRASTLVVSVFMGVLSGTADTVRMSGGGNGREGDGGGTAATDASDAVSGAINLGALAPALFESVDTLLP